MPEYIVRCDRVTIRRAQYLASRATFYSACVFALQDIENQASHWNVYQAAGLLLSRRFLCHFQGWDARSEPRPRSELLSDLSPERLGRWNIRNACYRLTPDSFYDEPKYEGHTGRPVSLQS